MPDRDADNARYLEIRRCSTTPQVVQVCTGSTADFRTRYDSGDARSETYARGPRETNRVARSTRRTQTISQFGGDTGHSSAALACSLLRLKGHHAFSVKGVGVDVIQAPCGMNS